MDISVVIPTCNRKDRLVSLLSYLTLSTYPLKEIIIVDSGEDRLKSSDLENFPNLNIIYIDSEKSVCIQRNKGINTASSPWIFLCDDDIEMPPDYLEKLTDHITKFPEAGAVSGMVLQKEKNDWVATYPETSAFQLFWKYVFGLSIWGEIKTNKLKSIRHSYLQKGNHISKAGWPVITDFGEDFFTTPVYGLGASLVKKDWLLQSPYDEVLDRHGIGDNYGVALGFPAPVHVIRPAFVYHHQEMVNRLEKPRQYLRRALALDYFRKKNKGVNAKKHLMLWSLTGSFLLFLFTGDFLMTRAGFKTLWRIAFKKNPYYVASINNKKITEPEL